MIDKLLAIITAVLTQNMSGISKLVQFAWLRFTMYALVKPANIIKMLPIATHKVNLCGWILFFCAIATVLISSFILINPQFIRIQTQEHDHEVEI